MFLFAKKISTSYYWECKKKEIVPYFLFAILVIETKAYMFLFRCPRITSNSCYLTSWYKLPKPNLFTSIRFTKFCNFSPDFELEITNNSVSCLIYFWFAFFKPVEIMVWTLIFHTLFKERVCFPLIKITVDDNTDNVNSKRAAIGRAKIVLQEQFS